MALVEKYLNISDTYNPYGDYTGNLVESDQIYSKLFDSVNQYQKYFTEFVKSPSNVKSSLLILLENYINEQSIKIKIENADINYYIENINIFSKQKFKDVIKKVNIDHVISMMDYSKKSNDENYYKQLQHEYYKMFNEKIINDTYKINKHEPSTLDVLIDELFANINFNNLITFTQTLNRLKYFDQDINKFVTIIQNKFDSKDNIKKLIGYIKENFVEEKEESVDKFNYYDEQDKKYNFRFVIDNLKSNGFSLFEEYYLQIKTRYAKDIDIQLVKNDKKLIWYFMRIVSQKDSNSVNRYVNEMLIRMRDYLNDIEDSYKNTLGFQKIKVNACSEKYKDFDLTQLNRQNYNFTSLKYNFGKDVISKYTVPSQIEPYFDIYKSFYTSRYPDRQIEFDIERSTLITKINTNNNQIYYIHMALIQFIVYDKINKSNGINIIDLFESTGIPVNKLQDTINSFMKIKLIGRSNGDSVEKIKFMVNDKFTYDKNKISIASLILKESTEDQQEKTKEFLHDRNMIVLCNLIDYVKKNKYFTADTILDEFKYKKIPFNVTQNLMDQVISEAVSKEFIKKITVPNNSNGSTNSSNSDQIMYQYVE